MKFSRYLLGSFVGAFLLVTLGSIVVFTVIDFVSNIRMWLGKGLADTGEYYLNYLPYIVYLVSPVALLLTTIAIVGGMARHLEITAMQCAGRSTGRILLPILLFGFLLTGGLLALEETILPDSNHRRIEIAQTNAEKKKNPRIKERSNFVFIGSDKSSWFFRHYSSVSRQGRDVAIIVQEGGTPTHRFDAKRVKWEDSLWVLENGWSREFKSDGSLAARQFKTFKLSDLTAVYPSDLINDRQTAEEMDSQQIEERIESLRRGGEDTTKMQTQWHFKFSGPVTALVTLLIALSLSHRFDRNGGLSRQFGIGIILTFGYYILIRVGVQMGENGVLSPWLGAWLGNIVFGVVGILMLARSFRV
jgi:lipopolysaccharide export system permease protein